MAVEAIASHTIGGTSVSTAAKFHPPSLSSKIRRLSPPRPWAAGRTSALTLQDAARSIASLILAGTVVLTTLGGCGTVSGTDRTQLNMYSVDQEISLGDEAYREMLAGVDTVDEGPRYRMVVEVSDRIAAAARRLHPEIADRFDWEVVLIQDDAVVNAWALPGGKMAVYTGILPITRTPDGLAAVMGHEAAHAIARHGGENLTRQGLVSLVAIGASIASDPDDRELVAAAAGAYGLLGEPAFSRQQETEADELGILLAADAGYDPRESISVWTRMGALGGEPPEFLSTHPNSRTRIENLQALMPAAMEIRRRRLEAGMP